jgi:hypothetical protein
LWGLLHRLVPSDASSVTEPPNAAAEAAAEIARAIINESSLVIGIVFRFANSIPLALRMFRSFDAQAALGLTLATPKLTPRVMA